VAQEPDTGALLRDRAAIDQHEDVWQPAVQALATGRREDAGTGCL
jgi:hypothetical protein